MWGTVKILSIYWRLAVQLSFSQLSCCIWLPLLKTSNITYSFLFGVIVYIIFTLCFPVFVRVNSLSLVWVNWVSSASNTMWVTVIQWCSVTVWLVMLCCVGVPGSHTDTHKVPWLDSSKSICLYPTSNVTIHQSLERWRGWR